jgi:hypothetical protein
MGNECYYCSSKKAVKTWPVTDEPVCLSCRLSFLADEFEQTASKDECGQVRFFAELMEDDFENEETKCDLKGGGNLTYDSK